MAQFVLTAQIALQAPGNTKQVINQIRQQLQGINVNVNLKANTSQLNNVNAQLTQTSKTAKVAEKSISELARSLGSAARRFGVIAIATGTFINLSRAIKSSLGDAIEFERQLVNLSQVTGKSVQNLQEITGEITRLSTGLGVSSDQLLKTSIILAQAGLEARKVKSALEVLAKTELASSFDNITNTTEGAIAVLSQFRREAAAAGGDVIYLEQALGAINDVSKKFAVESADLVAVIRRSGGAFEAAGGSLNELLALFTSVRATTRESAETIATGLRTIFTRIQRVDTIAQLQQLGIVLQDVEGKFVGPFEAIKRISEGLSSLDPRDFRFSAIVEELGGYRQIGKVIPLIKQFTLAQDALNTAQAASGSLTKDAETAQLSLANQLAKVREEFQALIRQFVDSGAFRDVAGGALQFARALIRIADALEPVLPLLAGLTAFQIGKGFIPALSGLTGLNRKNAGGRIQKFATGGFVPGSGNRDTVPAMLTPGEFVIRKSSAKKIGAERLQRLNKGGPVLVSELLGERSGAATIKKALYDKKLRPFSNLEPNDTVVATIKQSEIRLDKNDFESIWNKAQTAANDAVKRDDKKAKPRDYSKLRLTEEVMKEADTAMRNQGKGLPRSEDVSLYMSAENRWGKAYEEIMRDKANKKIKNEEKKWQLTKATSYPVDLIKDGDEFAAGEAKFKSRKTEQNDLISKLLRRRIDKGQLSSFIENSKNKVDSNINLGTLDYFFAGDQKTSFLDWVRKNKIQEANRGGIIQKFAGGGIVDVLTGKESVAALVMTDYPLGPKSLNMDYSEATKAAIINSLPKKAQGMNITLPQNLTLDQYGLNQAAGSGISSKLQENLIMGAGNAVNQTVAQMSDVFSSLGIQADFKNLLPENKIRSAITGSVIGSLFESIVANLSSVSKDRKDDSFFDFVGPLGENATKLFEKSNQINNSTYKDAKKTVKLKDIESKIINQANKELGISTDIKSVGNAKSGEEVLDKIKQANLLDRFKTEGLSKTMLEKQGGVPKKGSLPEFISSMEARFGSRVEFRPNPNRKPNEPEGLFFLNYATGGAAPSDKAPALLTPGEFVVNKASAQEIGYTNLNRMNKTGKIPGYAKGGIVGAKRFATGGPVTPSLNTGAGGPPTQELQALQGIFDRLAQQSGGLVTSFNLLQAAIQEAQSAGIRFKGSNETAVKGFLADAKKKAAAEKIQIDNYNSLNKSQKDSQEALIKTKEGLSKFLSSAQNFVFLGSSIAALTAQFSSLDQATTDATTQTLGMVSGVIAVIGTVGDLILSTGAADAALKFFTASVTRAATASTATSATSTAGGATAGGGLLARLLPLITNPIGAVIATVVVALSAFAVYLYFIQARAKKVAEGLKKSADEIAASIEQGKGGSIKDFVNLQVNAAKTVADSYITLGRWLDYFGITSAKARQKEIDAVERAASAYISTIDTIAKADKELAAIDLDKSLKPAEVAFKKIAAIAQEGATVRANLAQTSPAKEIRKLADREGVFKPVSQLTESDFSNENAKAAFQLLQKSLVSTFENLEKRSTELQSLAQTQLESVLQTTDFAQVATQDFNLDGVIDSFDTILSQNQNFSTSFTQVVDEIIANGFALADQLRTQGKFVEAAQIEQQEKKRAKALEESAIKQSNAFKKAQEGTIAFQKALEANLIQFRALRATIQSIESLNAKIKDFGNRMSDLNNVMSGELMSFEIPEIQGLSNLSDIKDFDKFKTEIGKLGSSMGPNGQRLANQLIDSASLMENAKKELTGINFAQIGTEGENAARTAFEKAFGQSGQLLKNIFGEQIGGQLGTTIQKQLEDSIRTASERGGMVDPIELEKILDPLEEVIEENRVLFESLNNAQREYINQYNSTNKMLFEVMKKDVDGRQKLVDIQNRALNRLDQATNKSVSFQEKEARRNRSRGARLGAVGVGGLNGDIRGMGSALSTVNKRLEANAELIRKDDRAKSSEVFRKAQAGLTLQANELKRSLEELADQSDKAADVMSEIEKERAKRETVLKIVEDFVVGGEEQRTGINKQFMGLQAAMMAGSLQVLPEEERKASFGLLEQLSAVDDRFKAIKESLVISDAMRMGLDPQIAMALATATPKEQQLLQELKAITQQEIAAQQELNRINAEFGDKLSKELANLSAQINNLGAKIETTFAQKTAEAATKKAGEDVVIAEAKQKQDIISQSKGKLEQARKQEQDTQAKIEETAPKSVALRQKANFEINRDRTISTAPRSLTDFAINATRTGYETTQAMAGMVAGPAGAMLASQIPPNDAYIGMESYAEANAREARNASRAATNQSLKLEGELFNLRKQQQEQQQKTQKAFEDFNATLKKIGRAPISYDDYTAGRYARGGLIYRETGGSIFQPKGTDTVPAMLTPGEFVMQKSAVDKYGTGFMQSLNSGSYANRGGSVGRSGVSYFQNGGTVLEYAQSKLNTFARTLGVKPQDLVTSFIEGTQSNLPQGTTGLYNPQARSIFISNMNRKIADFSNPQAMMELVDHEIAHAIDFYYGKNNLASLGKSKNVMKSISKGYFRNSDNAKNFFNRILGKNAFRSYITDAKDLQAFTKLSQMNATSVPDNASFINGIIKRNPKVLAEGFPLVFQKMNESQQLETLDSIKNNKTKIPKSLKNFLISSKPGRFVKNLLPPKTNVQQQAKIVQESAKEKPAKKAVQTQPKNIEPKKTVVEQTPETTGKRDPNLRQRMIDDTNALKGLKNQQITATGRKTVDKPLVLQQRPVAPKAPISLEDQFKNAFTNASGDKRGWKTQFESLKKQKDGIKYIQEYIDKHYFKTNFGLDVQKPDLFGEFSKVARSQVEALGQKLNSAQLSQAYQQLKTGDQFFDAARIKDYIKNPQSQDPYSLFNIDKPKTKPNNLEKFNQVKKILSDQIAESFPNTKLSQANITAITKRQYDALKQAGNLDNFIARPDKIIARPQAIPKIGLAAKAGQALKSSGAGVGIGTAVSFLTDELPYLMRTSSDRGETVAAGQVSQALGRSVAKAGDPLAVLEGVDVLQSALTGTKLGIESPTSIASDTSRMLNELVNTESTFKPIAPSVQQSDIEFYEALIKQAEIAFPKKFRDITQLKAEGKIEDRKGDYKLAAYKSIDDGLAQLKTFRDSYDKKYHPEVDLLMGFLLDAKRLSDESEFTTYAEGINDLSPIFGMTRVEDAGRAKALEQLDLYNKTILSYKQSGIDYQARLQEAKKQQNLARVETQQKVENLERGMKDLQASEELAKLGAGYQTQAEGRKLSGYDKIAESVLDREQLKGYYSLTKDEKFKTLDPFVNPQNYKNDPMSEFNSMLNSIISKRELNDIATKQRKADERQARKPELKVQDPKAARLLEQRLNKSAYFTSTKTTRGFAKSTDEYHRDLLNEAVEWLDGSYRTSGFYGNYSNLSKMVESTDVWKLATELIQQEQKLDDLSGIRLAGSIQAAPESPGILSTLFGTGRTSEQDTKNEIDRRISNLKFELQMLRDRPTTEGNNAITDKMLGLAKGGTVYRALGGSIFQPKGTDTVPAMLTPGEFVMQKSAVDKYGVDTMNAMNQGALYASKGKYVKKDRSITVPKTSFDSNITETNPQVSRMIFRDQRDKAAIEEATKSGKSIPEFYKGPSKNDIDWINKLDQMSNDEIDQAAKSYGKRAFSSTNFSPDPKTKIAVETVAQNIEKPPVAPPPVAPPPVAPAPMPAEPIPYNDTQGGAFPEYVDSKYREQGYQKDKRAEYAQKRRQDEIRKRQIRSGEIDPMEQRRKDIQEKLLKRQFNIATSRQSRKQQALPSYMRSETVPENLQSFENFKASQQQAPQFNMGMMGMGMGMQPNMAAGAQQYPMAAQNPMMAQNPAMAAQMRQGGGAPAMGGQPQSQPFNFEPIMKLQQTFDNLAAVLGNMQMTHQVNVDGALNINGVNTVEVANAIQQALGQFIASEVKRIINDQGYKI